MSASAGFQSQRNNKRCFYIEEEPIDAGYGDPYKRPRFATLGLSDGAPEIFETLATMFPELNRSTIESVMEASGRDTETAIARLNQIRSSSQNSYVGKDAANANVRQSERANVVGSDNSEILREHGGSHGISEFATEKVPISASEWVNHFVQQMASASDMESAKSRAASALEAFAKAVTEDLHQENAILKERMLKQEAGKNLLLHAVSIQQQKLERSSEENQQLKKAISEYQERIRNMEMEKRRLGLYMQKLLPGSTMKPGRYDRDVF